ncbi:MAG: hypothetical protein LBQ34_07060 [Alphaproteobacteria bacterium]|jgi:hypothetical protein|nr:hypothetical protein [Alphaproteobacteria bacterium]
MRNLPTINLLINNNIYKHKFDFEVIKENTGMLNISLYNLPDEEDFKDINIEILCDNTSIFKGKAVSYNLEEAKGRMFVDITATDDNSFSYEGVNFNGETKTAQHLIKVRTTHGEDGFKYIQMASQFNAELSVGDVINYNQNLYAVESIIYTMDDDGFRQEIHSINQALHAAKYLG